MENIDIKSKMLDAYLEYRQLSRELEKNAGDDLRKAYNYIDELASRNGKIAFTNVELDLGYFDFYYGDMILTISTFNDRGVARLSESMEIYLTDADIMTVDFSDLEKHVLSFYEEKFC